MRRKSQPISSPLIRKKRRTYVVDYPSFYDRDDRGVPRRWIATVKESIRTVAPRFSARRMVKEYVERMYAPALERSATVGQ